MTRFEVQVRRATLSDVGAIARVQVASWRSAYRGQIPDEVLDSLDESERAARWSEWVPHTDKTLLVALRDEDIVGFCSLVPSRDSDAASADGIGEIAALYVEPVFWRCGVGRSLLRAAFEAARLAGYRTLTLWVLASNELARCFYEREGFVSDGIIKSGSIRSYPLHEVRYRCELTAEA